MAIPCPRPGATSGERPVGKDGIRAHDGRIDVLVNNAAFTRWLGIREMSADDELRTMRVGCDGMIHTTRAVLPAMVDGGYGHIVNIGSSAGKVLVGVSSAAYAAAKAGVDAYTQTLQVELARTPVHVMLVRPATIAGTDFFRSNVSHERMTRVADFMPYLLPPQAADALLAGWRTASRYSTYRGTCGSSTRSSASLPASPVACCDLAVPAGSTAGWIGIAPSEQQDAAKRDSVEVRR